MISGFIDRLYGVDARRGHDHKPVDPDEVREKAKKQADVIAAVKACGHLADVDCDCET